ncbi:glucose-1-phosphate adenylyltransferase [Salegentibacter salinarum]|uniref:Glucose-1-phosphate adenylyltransferase n=1 Tax=Salegentibacter salinarum TaxID=447422 RepID=A0A2N0U0U2_9FLAO|nr:glucose-1-phosphate adenylyltransferase [Salegentibacter salinarum]PKD20622.1 glucose-1-phosphate adenylyltransferase [Salegentibacter salinarum]SKB83426.1 glucose-1-phosphate adenylyltransferase [Salegentibacter salinarum]
MLNDKVLSVILGGGQGTRLHPLTESRSKPAVPIAGKYRLVDIPISNCINADLKRMYVLTQFNSASLNKHIKNTYHFSFFSSAFVDVLAAEQTPHNKTWYQGTADAVRQGMHHFKKHRFDYFLILSGDQLYHMDYNLMVQQHIDTGADITIGTVPVNAKEAPSFGIMKTDKDNNITSFIEKPNSDLLPDWTSPVGPEMEAEGRNYLGSMGIYVFNRKLLEELMDDESTVDFGKEIIPQAIGHKKVCGYQFEGYWTDIGNIESFFEANIGLTDDIPKFNLYDMENRVYTRARILPTSKISGTNLKKAVIAEGCIIHAKEIESSVIGVRSRIGKGSVIKNCYMMGTDFYESLKEIEGNNIEILAGIGENCNIQNAIIDKNCRVGDNTTINGGPHLEDDETDAYVVKEGIVVLKKEAVLPPGTTIG